MAIADFERGRDRPLGLARGDLNTPKPRVGISTPLFDANRQNMLRSDHASAVVIPHRTRMGTNAILQA
jgi:hypothetical protein